MNLKTKQKYLKYIQKVCKALSNHLLYIKQWKCITSIKNIVFYRYIVINNTVKVITSKIKIIN